jgi:chromosome partitioning protein
VEDSVLTLETGMSEPAAGPYAIVVGNQKGGTGKSTTAIHLALALQQRGYRVGTVDLDARQATLSHFLENRRAHADSSGIAATLPLHRQVETSTLAQRDEAAADEATRFEAALTGLSDCDFVVIDTPGADANLARLGHGRADTLITPVNDSLYDIDVLARIDVARREVLAPSGYTQLVWEANNQRVVRGDPPVDWIVMRNRLAHIDARNMRDVAGLLEQLARRIGFRLAPGFGERVVYRELFDRGLTVLDLPADPASASRDAARREIDALLKAIGLVPAMR